MKKILVILLSALLILGVFASCGEKLGNENEIKNENAAQNQSIDKRDILISGNDGQVTWTIYTDGELVYDGVGMICQLDEVDAFASSANKITMKIGITGVANGAFLSENFSNVTSITFSEYFAEIGNNSFIGLTGLKSMTILNKNYIPLAIPADSLTDIYYVGSESDWDNTLKNQLWGSDEEIAEKIAENKQVYTIHYNYS